MLVRSSGWAMMEYLAYPLMMLAAMPLYLRFLGTVQYGQWMLLLTITGFGGLAGLGMGPTATLMVAAARGRGSMLDASEAVRTCLAITLVSAFALAGLILILGWSIGNSLFSKVGSPADIFVIVGYSAYLLTLEQIDSVFAGALRGLERFDVSARVEIGAKMLQVICTTLVAWQTQNIFQVFLTASVIASARTGLKLLVAQRQFSVAWLSPKWNPVEVRVAIGFGKWIWLQSVGSLMFAVVDRALIGSMLGAEALARYAIAVQLAQQIQTIPAAGAQVLFPAVAKRQDAGYEWRRLALNACGAVAMLGIACGAGVLLFGDWFLKVWVGPTLAAEISPILPWLAVAYALLSLPTGAHYVLLGSGQARIIAIVTVLAGLVAVSITPGAIAYAGLIGAPAGRIGYALITFALVPAMFLVMRKNRQRTIRENGI